MPLKNEVLLIDLPIPPQAEWLARMKSRFPGVEVRWHQATVLPSSSLSSIDELPAEVLDGVTMVCLYPEPDPASMKDVRFVQLASAGSDRWVGHPKFEDRSVKFCSSSGVHPPQIGEWIIGTWLAFEHNLAQYAFDQRDERWAPRLTNFGTDSVGRRMGILGYGAIGRHAARLAKALGMEIHAYTQSPRPTPESRRINQAFLAPGTGDPEGELPSKWFSGAELEAFLGADLDILVVAIPLTDQTRHLISRKEFDILGRKGTFVSNVARGAILDTDALMEALNEGKIRGAAVDVTDPEPLPRGHPLWKAKNIFISPHIAYQSTNVFLRVIEILYRNLERLESGEPLLNEIVRG